MQQVLPPKSSGYQYQDDWGTSKREGYVDLGPARPMKVHDHEGGTLLKTVGAVAIVAGICWGTYLVAQSGNWKDVVGVLEANRGPVAVIGLGALSSLLGRFLRI